MDCLEVERIFLHGLELRWELLYFFVEKTMHDRKMTDEIMAKSAFSIEKSREVRQWLLETFADEKNDHVKLSVFDVIGSLILREKSAVEDVDINGL